MSDQTFTPAMGRFAPTRLYDPVVALTRERLWRALAVMYAAPRPDDVLAVARQKAAGCSAVQWRIGMGDALVDSVGADSADTA
jgi:hypothetical protein